MATKTITTNITLQALGPNHQPPRHDPRTGHIVDPGINHTLVHPPGTPVELEADEADRILARWGGTNVDTGEEFVGAGIYGAISARR